MEFKFYRVKNEIIDKYYGIDDRVMNNYNEQRVYIGVLVKLSNYNYILPLSSPKEKDYIKESGNLKKSTFTVFRMEDFDNQEEKEKYIKFLESLTPEARIIEHKTKKNLGKILLSNMIPVKNEDIIYVDIAKEEEKYGNLLLKQYNQIKKYQKKILTHAKIIYSQKIKGEKNSYLESCCDYKKLENFRDTF